LHTDINKAGRKTRSKNAKIRADSLKRREIHGDFTALFTVTLCWYLTDEWRALFTP